MDALVLKLSISPTSGRSVDTTVTIIGIDPPTLDVEPTASTQQRQPLQLAKRTKPMKADTGGLRCASCTRPLAAACESLLCDHCKAPPPATATVADTKKSGGVLCLLAPTPFCPGADKSTCGTTVTARADVPAHGQPRLALPPGLTLPESCRAGPEPKEGAAMARPPLRNLDTANSDTEQRGKYGENAAAPPAAPPAAPSAVQCESDAERAQRWALYQRAVALHGPPGTSSPATARLRNAYHTLASAVKSNSEEEYAALYQALRDEIASAPPALASLAALTLQISPSPPGSPPFSPPPFLSSPPSTGALANTDAGAEKLAPLPRAPPSAAHLELSPPASPPQPVPPVHLAQLAPSALKVSPPPRPPPPALATPPASLPPASLPPSQAQWPWRQAPAPPTPPTPLPQPPPPPSLGGSASRPATPPGQPLAPPPLPPLGGASASQPASQHASKPASRLPTPPPPPPHAPWPWMRAPPQSPPATRLPTPPMPLSSDFGERLLLRVTDVLGAKLGDRSAGARRAHEATGKLLKSKAAAALLDLIEKPGLLTQTLATAH